MYRLKLLHRNGSNNCESKNMHRNTADLNLQVSSSLHASRAAVWHNLLSSQRAPSFVGRVHRPDDTQQYARMTNAFIQSKRLFESLAAHLEVPCNLKASRRASHSKGDGVYVSRPPSPPTSSPEKS
eukprot:3923938-Pleurochrysis_carterae.AAC.2